MNKFRAIIIDDEASSRENLSLLLSRFCPEIELMTTAKNLVEGVAYIKANKIDLVFLDVEMPDYAGYEISSFFEEIDFEIIFITAYDKYAIKAFELAAIDYLLKPIDVLRLQEAVLKFSHKKELIEIKSKLNHFKKILKTSEEPTYSIHVDGYKKMLKINDILAIEGQGAYAKIYTANNNCYMVSKNIAEVEKELNFYNIFYRSHKSWIINMKEINHFSKSKYSVMLNGEIEAKISRQKIKEFLSLVG